MQNRIKAFRQLRGWTQQELADRVGISLGYLKKLENNRVEGSHAIKVRVAAAFDVAINEIFLFNEGQNDQ